MAIEKEKGGLGLRNIQNFNEALLAKQLWRLITKPILMMSKVIKAKYYPDGGLLNAKATKKGHGCGKIGLEKKHVLQKDLRYQVEDGTTIKIWESPWTGSAKGFKLNSRKPEAAK